jgi:hypothetical protein
MYAVLVTLEIDATRMDEAMQVLNGFAIPTITKGAGYVSGTWMRSGDGTRGHSLHLYETEADASAAAERAAAGGPPGAPIRFVSADVFEVIAQSAP